MTMPWPTYYPTLAPFAPGSQLAGSSSRTPSLITSSPSPMMEMLAHPSKSAYSSSSRARSSTHSSMSMTSQTQHQLRQYRRDVENEENDGVDDDEQDEDDHDDYNYASPPMRAPAADAYISAGSHASSPERPRLRRGAISLSSYTPNTPATPAANSAVAFATWDKANPCGISSAPASAGLASFGNASNGNSDAYTSGLPAFLDMASIPDLGPKNEFNRENHVISLGNTAARSCADAGQPGALGLYMDLTLPATPHSSPNQQVSVYSDASTSAHAQQHNYQSFSAAGYSAPMPASAGIPAPTHAYPLQHGYAQAQPLRFTHTLPRTAPSTPACYDTQQISPASIGTLPWTTAHLPQVDPVYPQPAGTVHDLGLVPAVGQEHRNSLSSWIALQSSLQSIEQDVSQSQAPQAVGQPARACTFDFLQYDPNGLVVADPSGAKGATTEGTAGPTRRARSDASNQRQSILQRRSLNTLKKSPSSSGLRISVPLPPLVIPSPRRKGTGTGTREPSPLRVHTPQSATGSSALLTPDAACGSTSSSSAKIANLKSPTKVLAYQARVRQQRAVLRELIEDLGKALEPLLADADIERSAIGRTLRAILTQSAAASTHDGSTLAASASSSSSGQRGRTGTSSPSKVRQSPSLSPQPPHSLAAPSITLSASTSAATLTPGLSESEEERPWLAPDEKLCASPTSAEAEADPEPESDTAVPNAEEQRRRQKNAYKQRLRAEELHGVHVLCSLARVVGEHMQRRKAGGGACPDGADVEEERRLLERACAVLRRYRKHWELLLAAERRLKTNVKGRAVTASGLVGDDAGLGLGLAASDSAGPGMAMGMGIENSDSVLVPFFLLCYPSQQ